MSIELVLVATYSQPHVPSGAPPCPLPLSLQISGNSTLRNPKTVILSHPAPTSLHTPLFSF